MPVLTVVGLTAIIAQYWLITASRQLGQFPYLPFGLLITAALVWGFSLRKIEKDDEIPLTFPKDFNLKFQSVGLALFITSIFTLALTLTLYASKGYSPQIITGWIISILLALLAFRPLRGQGPKHPYTKSDLKVAAAILIVAAPLYLVALYQIPWQVNTDEVAIAYYAQKFTTEPTDLLGPSTYFGFPSLIFVIWGHLANLIGGVNLQNIRAIHAISGLVIIASSYMFFRLFFKTPQAIVATVILGASHALIAISRMAMRDNTSLLVEIVALIFLFRGLITKSPLAIFVGGTSAGFSFYTYFPSRATPILWFLFLGLAYIWLVHKVKLATVLKIALVSLIGFLMAASPIITATIKDKGGLTYSKQTTLVFSEGRELAQKWAFAPDVKTAVQENIVRSLLTFNSAKSDEGWIYPNLGHGFADPITGVLIWLGLGVILFKKRKDLEDVLVVGSFTLLLLSFAFIFNKAPSYTRLLVILPFVAFLAAEGLSSIARLPSKVMPLTAKRQIFILGLGTLAIVIFNLWIFADFVKKGFKSGNDVGTIGRYIENASKNNPDRQFYIAADDKYPLYSWGNPSLWLTWSSFFASSPEKVKILDPSNITSLENTSGTFTIFMNRQLWQETETTFTRIYPNLKIHPITPNGSHLAVEII